MGSGPFAGPALDIIAANYLPAAIVTQPDRPRGRGRQLQRGSIALRGDELGVPVIQPASFREGSGQAELAGFEPDILVVASYGRILPQSVLDIPKRGVLNLHPSLLPKHRGPTPIASAILAGDEVTGVTVMEMVLRMDAGPVIAQRQFEVGSDDTAGSLTPKLAVENAKLFVEILEPWLEGELASQPQDEELATYSKMLTKESGRLEWSKPATQLAREVRAYTPWPVAYTYWGDRMLRVLQARPVDSSQADDTEPGTVIEGNGEGLSVKAGEGTLVIEELQLAGGKPMSAAAFVAGHRSVLGGRLNREGK